MSKLSSDDKVMFFTVGKIVSTHGLKGEVKVYPTTDDPDRFKSLQNVILQTDREELFLTVERVRFFKQLVIVKFKEFNDINDVEKYRGARLLVRREDAAALNKDEYYDADLVGCEAADENGIRIGELTEVMHTGANDVYAVKMDDGREVLIPAIRQCILNVDIDGRKIKIHMLEGLL